MSELGDILSECRDVGELHKLLTGLAAFHKSHNVRVYVGPEAEAEARVDAEGRLRAQDFLVKHLREMDKRDLSREDASVKG